MTSLSFTSNPLKKSFGKSFGSALVGCLLILSPCLWGQKISKASGNLNALTTWTDLIEGTGTINISVDEMSGTYNGDEGAIEVGDVLFNDSDQFVGIVAAISCPYFSLHNAAMAGIPSGPFKKQGIANTTLAPTGSSDEILVIKSGHTITISAGYPFTTTGTIINNGTIATDDILTFNSAAYVYYPNGPGNIDWAQLAKTATAMKNIDSSSLSPIAEIHVVDSINENRTGIARPDSSPNSIALILKPFQVQFKDEKLGTMPTSIDTIGENITAMTTSFDTTDENLKAKALSFDTIKAVQYTLVTPQAKQESGPKENNLMTNANNVAIHNHKNIIFKVQILASRAPASTKELKHKYSGDLKINNTIEDQWYKYSIGEFSSYAEAKQCAVSSNTHDAFIVAYINNVKVHISIAKAITKEKEEGSHITQNFNDFYF